MKTNTLPSQKRSGSGGGKILPALFNIIGMLILLAVIATYLPLTLPQNLGYQVYHVVSPSMEPAIPVDSAIYVRYLPPEEIVEGDVIAFFHDNAIVTHRVVRNQTVMGEITTKGDANPGEDFTPVNYNNVLGRVELSIPKIGALMRVYTSQLGKLYALILAACGVLFNLVAGRMRDRQREKLRQRLEEQMLSGQR